MTLDSPPGTHQDPLSDAELREKFLMCVPRAESRERAEELYEAFDSLRDLEEIRGLL
jgi:2-methylcitrate dehydratase PrpD